MGFECGGNTYPLTGRIAQAKQKGIPIMVVDQWQNRTARGYMDQFNPSTHIALINSMMCWIIRRTSTTKIYREADEGIRGPERTVENYADVEKITGVPVETVKGHGTENAPLQRMVSLSTALASPNSPPGPTTSESLGNPLDALREYRAPGVGVNPLRGQNNVQECLRHGCLSRCLFRLPEVPAPGSAEEDGGGLGHAGRIAAELMRVDPQYEQISQCGDPSGQYIFRLNPAVSPDSNHGETTLDKLDYGRGISSSPRPASMRTWCFQATAGGTGWAYAAENGCVRKRASILMTKEDWEIFSGIAKT